LTNLSSIEAIIFVGGRGTRLRTVVQDRPKVLALVNGRPFIFYLLDQLCQAGITRTILCTGYMGEYLEKMLGNQYKTLDIIYSREEVPLGTGGALREAANLVREEWILAMNGDSYIDIDYHNFISWHIWKGGNFSIVVVPVENSNRYGAIALDADQKVIEFVEKRPIRSSDSGLINAGVYLMSKSLTAGISSKGKLSLEREILPSLIDDGIFGYRVNKGFIDIGTPESFQSAPEFFESVLSIKQPVRYAGGS
jgi:NDP-sugar pyrophosphorylase family protein